VYYWLEWRAGRSRFSSIDERLSIIQDLEEGNLTAEEANQKLDTIQQSSWGKLASHDSAASQKHLRIRVSDNINRMVKSDLVIPMGLVNTVLDSGGRFSATLDQYDHQELQNLIAGTKEGTSHGNMEAGDDTIEITIE
jgi:hypothetical protein